jgi:hypothetical protein
MKATDSKCRIIQSFPAGHVYYREQFTNRIAVAQHSTVTKKGKVLGPNESNIGVQHCANSYTGIMYIDFARINKWKLQRDSNTVTGEHIHLLPLVDGSGKTLIGVFITDKEYQWLVGYF